MMPISCTLTGARGILSGLGREKIQIDLDPNEKSIAIRGDNGSGKSTLMNLGLVPWRCPPQSGNVYDHFAIPDGRRELEWTHNEQRYKTDIIYHQTATARKQTALLSRMAEDGQMYPVGSSDGKTSTYDAELARILGPQSVYYLSAFRAQGAVGLAEYAQPKELLRQLMGLGPTKHLAVKVGNVVSGLRRRYETITKEANAITDTRERIAQQEYEIELLAAGARSREENQLNSAAMVSTARAVLDAASLKDIDAAKTRAERSELMLEIERVKTESGIEEAKLRDYIANIDRSMHESLARFAMGRKSMETHRDNARNRRHSARRVLESREEIESAQAESSRLTDEIEKQNAIRADIDIRMEKRREREADVFRKENEHNSAVHTQSAIESKLNDLIRQAEYIRLVPCEGKPPYNTCPALIGAHCAAEDVPHTKERLSSVNRNIDRIVSDKSALLQLVAPIEPLQASMRDTAAAILSARKEKQHADIVAKNALLLAGAEAAVVEATAEMKSIERDMAEAIEHHEDYLNERRRDKSSAAESLESLKETARTQQSRLLKKLESLQDPGTSEAIASATAGLQHALACEREASDALANATATRASLDTSITALREQLVGNEKSLRESDRLGTEMSHWILLKEGLIGVINLTIEAAGPAIAATANHLLESAYGPRFSIRILTQRILRNQALEECFELSVIDSETGIESDLRLKSGGETVWLDRALSDAIAIYHQDSTGISYETLFSDETDDGLTRDRKDALYRMSDKMLELGNFRQRISISHDPGAWLHADRVIDMDSLK